MVRELLVIYGESDSYPSNRVEDVLTFVLEQLERMPWLPRCAIKTMTLAFGLSCSFYKDSSSSAAPAGDACNKQLCAWGRSSLRPCRDFVKFYAAMVVLSYYSDSKAYEREAL